MKVNKIVVVNSRAFHEAGGIAVAASVQAFLIVFIIAALLILAYAADRCNTGAASTIQDAMNGACGRAGKMLTSLAVVVYCKTGSKFNRSGQKL